MQNGLRFFLEKIINLIHYIPSILDFYIDFYINLYKLSISYTKKILICYNEVGMRVRLIY
jgi:hypothetical protein